MNVVVPLSGGMDSATLAAQQLKDGHQVYALGVNYGQRHVVELTAASAVAEALGIDYRQVYLSEVGSLLAGSLLTDLGPDSSPVVPHRNAVLISLATGYAVANGHGAVAVGFHQGDAELFPDCRPAFVTAMRTVCRLSGVDLWAPFLNKTKAEVANLGAQLGAPLAATWSCYTPRYDPQPTPCLDCLACRERTEALRAVPR